MAEPYFEVGMEVEFELDPEQSLIRWDYIDGKLTDRGYSGYIWTGVVTDIYVERLIVRCEFVTPNSNETVTFGIPLMGHPSYDPEQWITPGYPIPRKQITKKKMCDCGAWSAAGCEIEEGHSSWCEVFKSNSYVKFY